MSDIVAKMRAEYPLYNPRSVSLEIAMDVHALCDEITLLRLEVANLRRSCGETKT